VLVSPQLQSCEYYDDIYNDGDDGDGDDDNFDDDNDDNDDVIEIIT
jgi:hypothetical protein